MTTNTQHPAKELGAWLKARRQKQGFVARVFAGMIELSPAEYAEVEAGVVRWLAFEQQQLIPQVLSLTENESAELLQLIEKARGAEPLEFADLFTREQLEPMRLRRDGRKRLTQEDKDAILDAVFAPLA